ncbi:MAG: hypothetical protein KDD66_03805 [Bdellovibrionales bacterium]|nr:hypothetical protein [Bdellovibrionales bacterium]
MAETKVKIESKLSLLFSYFIFSRAYILALVVLVSSFTVVEGTAPGGAVYESWLVVKDLGGALEGVARSADAVWYEGIATNGYDVGTSPSTEQHNWTFFPLYPLMMRFMAPLFGSPIAAGLVISNLCFLLSLVVLQAYLLELGCSRQITRRSLWFLCIFPTTYFFSAPITESLFLLLSLSSFYLAARKNWISAGLVYALASATRPTALLILPAFALVLYQGGALRNIKGWLSLAIAPTGGLAFMGYLYRLTGDPLAFSNNQAAWNRFQHSFVELTSILAGSPETLMVNWNFLLINVLASLLGVALSIYLLTQKRYAWALILFLPIASALSTGSVMSMARFIAALFPTPIALAMLSKKRSTEQIITFILTGLLTIMCLLYGARATAGMA